MKTIQIQIDDKNYDSFMNILNNLKKGLIKNFTVNNNSIELVSNEEQNDIENILNLMTIEDKEVSYSKTVVLDI
ncbi:MAG: hypothetical protein RBR59_04535 [Sulfurimonadaceae bacterium]|jgi:hypothetical protein|nr:hypothetical protein [Sulfurimonadaceae bacterium]